MNIFVVVKYFPYIITIDPDTGESKRLSEAEEELRRSTTSDMSEPVPYWVLEDT